MRIDNHYRNAAEISLNGSIAALVPPILIIASNLSFIKNQEIMLLTIPFFLYSMISFQVYLFRRKRSTKINRFIGNIGADRPFFDARQLLVFYVNTLSPRLMFYFPNGHLAGSIRKYPNQLHHLFRFPRVYILCNLNDETIGYFVVKRRKFVKIEVYDQNRHYLGCLLVKKQALGRANKELLNEYGRIIGAVEGSMVYMDEKVLNQDEQMVGRLRRGWMPLEWSRLFPEPNTPILSFKDGLSNQDKLLRMTFLIHEFFIKR